MPTDRRIVWAPAARADLLDIWRFYADSTSIAQADDLLRAIQNVAFALNRLKTPGRPRDELLPGLRSVFRRPHTIFFRLQNDRIEIVRVLHERRDLLAQFDTEKT